MPFVSVTRLRVRSWRFMPGFLIRTLATQRQVVRADGFLGGSLLADRRRTFWTLTLWRDRAAMIAYMTRGDHAKAMPRLAGWCDEASVAHWTCDDAVLPAWTQAADRMRGEGRPSRVDRPGVDHAGMTFAAPRLTGAVPLRPAAR